MKLVLKQSGKALLFLILFLGSQYIVCMGMTFLYAFKMGLECAGNFPDNNVIATKATDFIINNTNLIVLLSGCLTIFSLWIFFSLIRGKKLLKEAGIRRFKVINVPIIILLAVSTTFMINCVLSFVPEQKMQDYASQSQNLMNGSLLVTIVSTIIIAPIVEEIIFRGFILSTLKSAMPVIISVLISSVLFAVMHGQIIWISYTFVLGILLSVVSIKTNSIASSMLFHFIFNLSGILIPYFMQDTSEMVNACIAVRASFFMILFIILINRVNKNLEIKVIPEV